MEGVSVIICTYNGRKTILQTIDYLFAQKITLPISWEIIIIDNASSDETYAYVQKYLSQYELPLMNGPAVRLLQEPTAGKIYALEKGFAESRYPYIIICDDDNWLDEEYVQTAYALMKSDARIGIIGGLGEPVCEITPPWWFEKLKMQYATGPQHQTNGEVERGWVLGAGMVVRKDIHIRLKNEQYKNLLLGRTGDKLSAGEDIELCYYCVLLGYTIHYHDKLQFKHYIPKQRLTWDYIIRLYKGSAEADIYLRFIRFFQLKHTKTSGELAGIYKTTLKKNLRWLSQHWWQVLKVRSGRVPEGNLHLLEVYYGWIRFQSLLKDRKKLMDQLHYLNTFSSRYKD
jgi:glycosyltransferase involved in cell wall biosynthesis